MSLIQHGIPEPNDVVKGFHDFFDMMSSLDEIENKTLVDEFCRDCNRTTKQHTMSVQQAVRFRHSENIQIKKLFCTSCKKIQYYYSNGPKSW